MKFELSFPKEFTELYEEYLNDPTKRKLIAIEGITPEYMDIPALSKKYFTENLADVSIDANANANALDNKNPNSYSAELSKGFLKLEGYYLIFRELEKRLGLERAKSLIKSVWDGDLYIHDASGPMIQSYYCYAYSTSRIMTEGRPWGQLHSKKPKRARQFMAQVIETTMDFSQQQAGAVAIADVIINYAYYAKRETLSDKDIENDFQNLIHILNQQFRVSGQSAFVNISLFDKHNLKSLFGEAVYPDFTHPDVEYVMKLQRIFLDFFSKGDPISEQPYRFPVVTCAFINDEKNGYPLDGEFLSYVCERTYQNGCTNIYISDDIGKISSCCRLQSDLKQLKGGDSFGNGGLNVGSGRVVAVNLASIGLQSKTEEEYFSTLESRLEDSKEILLAHRSLLHKRASAGFVPFISRGYVNIDRHLFSTIGINAIAEGVMFLTGKELHRDDGAKELAKRILKRIKDFSYECIDSTGFPFNVEEVPGESLAPKHALKDKIRYEQPLVIYSNQFVSLWADVDLFDRIRLEGEFSKSLTGGGIAHLNIEHVLASPEEMEKLVRFAISSGLEHFAINYAFNVCENDHSFVGGNHEINCPICGGKVKESLTRVVGYFTPVSAWNSVRREIEFGMRKFYGK